MSESRPSTPEEFPLVVTLLRENIQDLHQDIRDLRSELKQDIQDVRSELHSVRSELSQDIQDVRSELHSVRSELKEDIGDLGAKMDARFAAQDERFATIEARLHDHDLQFVEIRGELKLHRWILALILATTTLPLLQKVFVLLAA